LNTRGRQPTASVHRLIAPATASVLRDHVLIRNLKVPPPALP
jgi:hypothetical protein